MKTSTNDKILGCMLGAATGDAMGAPTETRSAEQIFQDFDGYVKDMITPPDDCFARGLPAGSITDDFSLAYSLAEELLDRNGNISEDAAEKAVLRWADQKKYLHFAGPTTLASIQRMRGNPIEEKNDFLAVNNNKATNGAAMKIFPVGLCRPGKVDEAIHAAITIAKPTHPNDTSISGACAIAAAVAKAVEPDADLDDVLLAGLYGARTGYKLSIQQGATHLAVPSVEKRILLALKIAKQPLSWGKTMIALRDNIGAGLMVHESVPCVFGILAANKKDVMGAITMGVNIGDDTDTVATMAGAVAGALYGISNIPPEYIPLLENVNNIKLVDMANYFERKFYT